MAASRNCAIAYGFEPKKEKIQKSDLPKGGNEGGGKELESWRTSDGGWCACGRCSIMPKVEECVCCKEVGSVRAKLDEDTTGTVDCITQHRRFAAVCIEPDVLRAVLVLLHDQQCSILEEPVSNRLVWHACSNACSVNMPFKHR